MPHSFGLRARTRSMFSRPFRGKGPVHLSTYMTTFKVGDYVDLKANASIHRGMPHKYYHGRTGVIFNVAKRAVGVIVHKRVGNRFMEKRVNVRIEHVKKSGCRTDFLKRVRENERLRVLAHEKKIRISLKRQPAQPKTGEFVRKKLAAAETLAPVPYEFLA